MSLASKGNDLDTLRKRAAVTSVVRPPQYAHGLMTSWTWS